MIKSYGKEINSLNKRQVNNIKNEYSRKEMEKKNELIIIRNTIADIVLYIKEEEL